MSRVPFEQIPVEEWDRLMAVNLRGPFLMVKYAAPAMIARKYGKIINISSGTAYKGMPLMLHYITSKGGIVAFTRALSRELGQHNICVNTLAPGLIKTEGVHAMGIAESDFRKQLEAQTPLGRIGQPTDFGAVAVFLASADSAWLTGEILVVSGGLR